MAVNDLRSGDLDAWFRTAEPACFRCGEKIRGIGVVWNGTRSVADGESGLIALHPTCAIELSVDLIGDARNAARIIEGKPLDAGINIRTRMK